MCWSDQIRSSLDSGGDTIRSAEDRPPHDLDPLDPHDLDLALRISMQGGGEVFVVYDRPPSNLNYKYVVQRKCLKSINRFLSLRVRA